MYIKVNGLDYELKTTLGVTAKIEKRFNSTVPNLSQRLATATVDELLDILIIAIVAEDPTKKTLRNDMLDEWGYFDLFTAAQSLFTALMFSGTPEDAEAKIDAYRGDENEKNALREMLGLPTKKTSAETSGGE